MVVEPEIIRIKEHEDIALCNGSTCIAGPARAGAIERNRADARETGADLLQRVIR